MARKTKREAYLEALNEYNSVYQTFVDIMRKYAGASSPVKLERLMMAALGLMVLVNGINLARAFDALVRCNTEGRVFRMGPRIIVVPDEIRDYVCRMALHADREHLIRYAQVWLSHHDLRVRRLWALYRSII